MTKSRDAMPKFLRHGLILTCLLTGCAAPVQVLLTPEPIEREGEITSANSGIPVTVRAMPSPRLAVTPRPQLSGSGRSSQASAEGAAGQAATDESGGVAAAGPGAPHLRFNGDAPPTLTLVPLFDDANVPTAVMAQPASGTLEWSLQGSGGPLALSKARIVLRREANRPTIAPPVADDDEPATPAPEQGEPMSIDVAAAEAGLPSSTGGAFRLKLDLKGAIARQFFAANPNAAKASATVTLLDTAGQPAPGPDGQPLTLTADITVL
jgi:hypothetical protein